MRNLSLRNIKGRLPSLKQELQQLKRGMMENPVPSTQEDLLSLKLQLEAGQVKLQSRLEEEEQAKAALMGRIQRLTKLILVSTKNTMSANISECPGHRRRHSFVEDELAYLPDRKREYSVDDETSEVSAEVRDDVPSLDELTKDYKRSRKRGMLGWFKLKKPYNVTGLSPSADSQISASGSPASCSKFSQSTPMFNDIKEGIRKPVIRSGDDSTVVHSFPERTQAGDLFSAAAEGHHLLPSGTTITDQIDLLSEQVKMLAGEVALCTSSLKRLSEKAANNPKDSQLREQIKKLKEEINEKKLHIHVLEQRMVGAFEMTPHASSNNELSQALSKLTTQLNEKTFEIEIKSADNRILQEQLQIKISENAELQETILFLRQQLNSLSDKSSCSLVQTAEENEIAPNMHSEELIERNKKETMFASFGETFTDDNTPTSVISLNRVFSIEDSSECNNIISLNSQICMQAAEIEDLNREKVRLTEERDGLEVGNKKLAEEASYAKELAAAAAAELKNLAEAVTKLSNENAKLSGELAFAKEIHCSSNCCRRSALHDSKPNNLRNLGSHGDRKRSEDGNLVEELQKELSARYQKESMLETALSERDNTEDDLRKRLHEARRHEEELESELASMWVQVAKFREYGNSADDTSSEVVHSSETLHTRVRNGFLPSNDHPNMFQDDGICKNIDTVGALEDLRAKYHEERSRCIKLEKYISRLKGEDIAGMDVAALEELQNLHVEAVGHKR